MDTTEISIDGRRRRSFKTFCVSVCLVYCLTTLTGCISDKAFSAGADAVAAKIFLPPAELVVSTMIFQKLNERWPDDYAELQSFFDSNGIVTLTNFDRVDFTQKADGSVAIFAVGQGMTNRMTLASPETR